MGEPVKGTVTSLSSLFPAEEAWKALRHVQDTIAECQKEINQLQGFFADNTNLINLVQKIPEELHHDIMVPFGKAAFFPGRLIHTNEFLVLLGEGYYADRTSKQTIEILKRRGKALESQVESFKAVMQDLKAEASFFDAAAADSMEGLVEITEEYVEETFREKVSKEGLLEPYYPSEAENKKSSVEEEELTHIFSRMDELEKEELEAANFNGCDGAGQNEVDFGHRKSELSPSPKVGNSEEYQLRNPLKQLKDGHMAGTEILSSKTNTQQEIFNGSNIGGSLVHPLSEEGSSNARRLAFSKSNCTQKASMFPEIKENVQIASTSKNEAFTGSIIERAHSIEMNPREQTTAHSLKPVSRFKMQRK